MNRLQLGKCLITEMRMYESSIRTTIYTNCINYDASDNAGDIMYPFIKRVIFDILEEQYNDREVHRWI